VITLGGFVGCSDDSTPRPDAGIDAEPDAALPDVEVPDVMDATVPDARPYSPWCGENPDPGPDPNAVPLTDDEPNHFHGFRVGGRRVVYSKKIDPVEYVPADYEVFVFDLDTWEASQITDADRSPTNPQILGDTLMWTDCRSIAGDASTLQDEIVQYDLVSGVETRLTETDDSEVILAFNSDYVLYDFFSAGEWESELRLVDRATAEERILAPLGSSTEGESMNGRFVSWVAIPPGSPYLKKDVYVHDIETGITEHLESTENGLTYGTSVSGSRVAWMDDRNGNWDIYLYDMETGVETRVTDDPFDQIGPTLLGELVLFHDYRFSLGWENNQDCARDLVILDLSTGAIRRITEQPWFWGGRLGEGFVVAWFGNARAGLFPEKLYYFDLVAMGILDPTGQHVLP
jgi:beta propeller repeat protein